MPTATDDTRHARPDAATAWSLLTPLAVIMVLAATAASVMMWVSLTEPTELARAANGGASDVARFLMARLVDFVVALTAWL